MNETAYHAMLRRLGIAPPAEDEPARPERRPSLGGAEAVARLLGMALDRFEQEGAPVEVRVRWLQATLWFVPAKADAEVLAGEGVSRGRIWTARELLDMLSIPGLTAEQVRTIAQAKVELDGDVVGVRPRRGNTQTEGDQG